MKVIPVIGLLTALLAGCTSTTSTSVGQKPSGVMAPSLAIQYLRMSCMDFLTIVQPVIEKRQGNIALNRHLSEGMNALVAASGFMTGQMYRHGHFDKSYSMYEGISIVACEANPTVPVGQAIIHAVKTEADTFPRSEVVAGDPTLYEAAARANFISRLPPNMPPIEDKCSSLGGLTISDFRFYARVQQGLPISPELRQRKNDFGFYKLAITASMAGMQIESIGADGFRFDPAVPVENQIVTQKQAEAFNDFLISKVCQSNPDNTILEAMVFTDENI